MNNCPPTTYDAIVAIAILLVFGTTAFVVVFNELKFGFNAILAAVSLFGFGLLVMALVVALGAHKAGLI